MNKPLKGEEILIHCYKHDGSVHRCWNKGFVLEETDSHFIVVNNRTLVIESDGRKWHTREPAICYFPKDRWFNVICMIRKNGVHFYCNIASPTLYDGEALKYIDYDLDLKVFPDYKYKILDEEEYKMHKEQMGYSERENREVKVFDLKGFVAKLKELPYYDEVLSRNEKCRSLSLFNESIVTSPSTSVIATA